METLNIVYTNNIASELSKLLSTTAFEKLYILTDENTQLACFPKIKNSVESYAPIMITIGAGDEHKDIASLVEIWNVLSKTGATRRALLINLGGGMITDIGGFAASTFKRGISYVNIPTSLLGAVDAAVGGKTGINFNGLKNEIGTFTPAKSVLISPEFLETLSHENILSGYAEMLKHALLSSDEMVNELLNFDITTAASNPEILKLINDSVSYKEYVVKEDPYEKGLRKALNLGHTVGHAFESMTFIRHTPVLHGYAVAWGLVCELILSNKTVGFPLETLKRISNFVIKNYGAFPITCDDYEELYELMTHDKKNDSGNINFTLLGKPGEILINQKTSKEDIFIMFDIYRDLFKL